MIPTVGCIVHYVSYGTPGGEYPSTCRAAIVTAVDTYQPPGPDGVHIGHVSLAVLNPDGMFFNRAVHYHDGAETPGSPDCPTPAAHGDPFRYCACGWVEASLEGGTWHWPERAPEPVRSPIVVNLQVPPDSNHEDVGRRVVEAIKTYEGRGDDPLSRA